MKTSGRTGAKVDNHLAPLGVLLLLVPTKVRSNTLAGYRPPQCAWSARLSCRHMCLNGDLSGTFWAFPRVLLSWKWPFKQQKTCPKYLENIIRKTWAQWIDFVPGIQLWSITVPDILLSLTGNYLLNSNAIVRQYSKTMFWQADTKL